MARNVQDGWHLAEGLARSTVLKQLSFKEGVLHTWGLHGISPCLHTCKKLPTDVNINNTTIETVPQRVCIKKSFTAKEHVFLCLTLITPTWKECWRILQRDCKNLLSFRLSARSFAVSLVKLMSGHTVDMASHMLSSGTALTRWTCLLLYSNLLNLCEM